MERLLMMGLIALTGCAHGKATLSQDENAGKSSEKNLTRQVASDFSSDSDMRKLNRTLRRLEQRVERIEDHLDLGSIGDKDPEDDLPPLCKDVSFETLKDGAQCRTVSGGVVYQKASVLGADYAVVSPDGFIWAPAQRGNANFSRTQSNCGDKKMSMADNSALMRASNLSLFMEVLKLPSRSSIWSSSPVPGSSQAKAFVTLRQDGSLSEPSWAADSMGFVGLCVRKQ